ncbi:MAG: hypothetical protein ACJAUW_000558 [Yoonia sp.]|jgi:hypothetical protein
MRSLAVLVLFAFPLSAFADSGGPEVRWLGRDVIEHGGGCGKSSPAGQCCHMQNSTGIVHCH